MRDAQLAKQNPNMKKNAATAMRLALFERVSDISSTGRVCDSKADINRNSGIRNDSFKKAISKRK